MPTDTTGFEAQHTYDMTQYLDGTQPEDFPLLNNLAQIIEGEITVAGAQPFAAYALDLAVGSPTDLRRKMHSQPPSALNVLVSLEDLVAEQKDPSVSQEVAKNHLKLKDLATERKVHNLQIRHDLGVRTCQLALDLTNANVPGRVALRPTSTRYGFIQPKKAVWSEIKRQHVDYRYKDYVIADSRSKAHTHELAARNRARNRLLVATAAYAVHQALGDIE